MQLTFIISILVGLAVMFAGRRLFWLFVALAGFVAGATLATRFFGDRSEIAILAVAIIAGLIGAVLAIVVKRFAIGTAGFLVGGFLATALLANIGFEPGGSDWIIFIVGGVIGTILVSALVDWALIVLSALGGSVLVLQSAHIRPALGLTLIAVGTALGIIVQARQLRSER